MKKLISIVGATVVFALLGATAASATKCPKPDHSRPPHGDSPCKKLEKWNPGTHKCVPIGPTNPPPTHGSPPPGNPPPHGTVPPIQSVPQGNPSEPREAFCVQTKERGETFIQAERDSFEPGGNWYTLWQTGATVSLDGHTVTLMLEDGLNGRQKGEGNGVILAANVPGVGLTCAQPYVTTDGRYADPAYGTR